MSLIATNILRVTFVLSAALCATVAAEPIHAATFITFDVPGCNATYVSDINAANSVIGWSCEGGFLRTADGTYTSFNAPGETIPCSINDNGAITGGYVDGNLNTHGFIREADGTITAFDVVGAKDTSPASINNDGVITGWYWESYAHGFLRASDGTLSTFDAPNSTGTFPIRINKRGAIVGWYYDSDYAIRGFLRTADGRMRSFNVPGADSTIVNSINERNMMTGFYTVQNSEYGFVRSADGSVVTFNYDCPTIDPTDINRAGTIITRCRQKTLIRHADGAVQKFTIPPGGNSPTPMGINDSGVIAGTYKGEIYTQGFLRIP